MTGCIQKIEVLNGPECRQQSNNDQEADDGREDARVCCYFGH